MEHAKQRAIDVNRREDIQRIRVAATLVNGPKTFEGILERTFGYLRLAGFFRIAERQVRAQAEAVRGRLSELKERGWVICEEERFALTPLGRAEVEKRFSQLGETGALLRQFLLPQTASIITLTIHLTLAAVKLPVALVSGSVGLLNDSFDTLLDALSSLLVYFGIRFKCERVINVALVGLMLAIGGVSLYEAGRRLIVPYALEVDGFPFVATIMSVVISLALYAYQRFVGLRSGTMSLIAQSVDSRNHVIVAASVMVGLVAALLRFPLLDALVGLGVALLVLKSAVELTIETVRSLRKEHLDLSRFEFGFATRYDEFRQTQLSAWMLYLVQKQAIGTRAELVARARQALDISQVPALRAMGLDLSPLHDAELIEHSLAELFRRGWLEEQEQLSVTDVGRRHLRRWT